MSEVPLHVAGYRVLEVLDDRGFATLYLVESKSSPSESPLVLKCVPKRTGAPDRAAHEAKLAQAVSGQRFPRIIESGRESDFHYLVMECVTGWNLSELIRAARSTSREFSISDVVRVGREMLAALHLLHEATDPETGIALDAVHRDIKPANVMLREDGAVLLIDLGVGRSNVQDWRTRAGAFVGTVGYHSPEQATGDAIDRRTDLYAVGAVLYALLTKRPYVEGESTRALMQAARAKVFSPPSRLRPTITQALDEALRTALQRNANDRFSTAQAMSDALEASGPWPAEGATLLEFAGADLPVPQAEPTVLLRRPSAYRDADPFSGAPDTADFGASAVGPTVDDTRVTTVSARVRELLPAGLILVAATIVVTFAVKVFEPRPQPVSDPRSPISIPIPAAPPAPGAIPRVSPDLDEPPAPPVDPAPRPQSAARKIRRKVVTRPPPQPSPSPNALYRGIVRRAREVQRLRPERQAEIDNLVADATLWHRAANVARAQQELSRIKTALDALAQ